jgi:serine protease
LLNLNRHLVALFAILVVACAGDDKGKDESRGEGAEAYIVVFKKSGRGGFSVQSFVEAKAVQVSANHGLEQPLKVFSQALEAGVYQLTEEQAQAVAQDPNVAYVEKDGVVRVGGIQSSPVWGLDRIDQQALPLNRVYNYRTGGATVNAYVIDTGVHVAHQDFQGRAFNGYDFVDKDNVSNDCNGHGTHVAGTIGGQTYGVAKSVRIFGVRVLDCSGSGRFSDVIAGVEWVTANHVKPAVANMSLGGGASQAIDDAVRASVQAGVTYVVAAGNSNESACNGSPSRVASALVVGATTKTDQRASFSNFGSCVDLFAPGQEITSAWHTSNSATKTIDGTSMAAPHVAGAVAIYLSLYPTASPNQVESALVSKTVNGRLTQIGTGSPNKLLNTQFLENEGGENPVVVPPGQAEIRPGETVGGLAGAQGSEKKYFTKVDAGTTKLVIEIQGGQGDADLYVRQGAGPSLTQYECRPYRSGNFEVCEIVNPKVGEYHIMVHAYTAYSGLSLKVTAEKSVTEISPCPTCIFEEGSLATSQASAYHPKSSYYVSGTSGEHVVFLRGPDSGDFELFLKRWDGRQWVNVAASTQSGSKEEIRFFGAPGYYTVQVMSFLGSGAYKLWRRAPQ